MFTATMGRSLSILSIAAAVAVASSAASAQVIISTDGSGVVRGAVTTMVRRAITVSDDSVRSYLTRFEPGVLDDDSGDANIVTMVLDNDGTYIRSSSRHAKLMEAVPARVLTTNGDSVKAFVVSSSVDPSAVVAAGEAAGTVVTLNTMSRLRAAGDAPSTLAGVSPDEIGGIATKRYSAGEMGKGMIILTFIYLK